jgi:hypothetical protein
VRTEQPLDDKMVKSLTPLRAVSCVYSRYARRPEAKLSHVTAGLVIEENLVIFLWVGSIIQSGKCGAGKEGVKNGRWREDRWREDPMSSFTCDGVMILLFYFTYLSISLPNTC